MKIVITYLLPIIVLKLGLLITDEMIQYHNYQYVGCIEEHRMQFCSIAGPLESPTMGLQHRTVCQGLKFCLLTLVICFTQTSLIYEVISTEPFSSPVLCFLPSFLPSFLPYVIEHCKGLVINYRERGAIKWENRRSKPFASLFFFFFFFFINVYLY